MCNKVKYTAGSQHSLYGQPWPSVRHAPIIAKNRIGVYVKSTANRMGQWAHYGHVMKLAGVKFLRMWNIWPIESRLPSLTDSQSDDERDDQ
jgi:hypothetical protein